VQTIDRRRFNTGLFLGFGLAGCAQAPAGDPDLIVTGLRWSEDDGATWHTGPIQAGSNVLFEADVKNQGAGPTPDGVIVGVAFLVDGNSVAWSDTHTSALPADQTIGLRANGGPDGDKYWNNAPAGNHTIRAWVDDTNRMPAETPKTNNTLDVPLSVTSGGGLQPPPQAAAAGYTRLVFREEFENYSGIDMSNSRQPGFNFYRHRPYGYPPVPTNEFSVSNSVLTLQQFSGDYAAMGLVSATAPRSTPPAWVGFAATGGAYFEARFRHGTDPGGWWPSFWSDSADHMWEGNYTQFWETDFYEKLPTAGNQWQSAAHHWIGVGQTDHNEWYTYQTPAGYDFNDFHTYGLLWVPADHWGMYNDDNLVYTYSYSSFPWLALSDDKAWPCIIGTGKNWPMYIDWVRVWQAP
jgi:hypothetical protein